MRMKRLLGLAAIAGAVAYAQKKRGGDLSLAGIKNSLRDMFASMRGQLGNQSQQRGRQQHAGAGATHPMSGGDDLGHVGSVGRSVGASSGVGSAGAGGVDIDIDRGDIPGAGSTGGMPSGVGADDLSSGSTGNTGYGSPDTRRRY